jgi:hypothetical protein
VPVAIHGHISETGQLAYYAFEVTQKQAFAFEVVALHGVGFDPQIALYEAGGSYLDPRRSRRLVFHEEVTEGGMPANRRMTYSFTKPGRYLVSLSQPFAQGGGNFSYLLRIAPAEGLAAGEEALPWGRRRFEELLARSVGAPAREVGLVRETEPNDQPEQAKLFEVPAVLEGTIGQPGDIDFFRFKARAGQKLAIEVQTPRAAPPHFNLRLDVLDARKVVVLSNLSVQDGKLGTVDAKLVQVAPQLLGTLDRDGEYTLRIRDLTSIHGSPDHVYRVLVRHQVPHLGDFQQRPPGPVNLRPGGRQRLTLSAPGKEGYAGTFALSLEGLPQGVKAFVGPNSSTIELVVDANAPGTPLPRMLHITGLPLVGGKSGSPFPVAEIPVMVVKK